MPKKDLTEREKETDVLMEKLKALGIPNEDLEPLHRVVHDFVHGAVSSSGKICFPSVSTHECHYKFSLQQHIPSDIRLVACQSNHRYRRSLRSPLGSSTKV